MGVGTAFLRGLVYLYIGTMVGMVVYFCVGAWFFCKYGRCLRPCKDGNVLHRLGTWRPKTAQNDQKRKVVRTDAEPKRGRFGFRTGSTPRTASSTPVAGGFSDSDDSDSDVIAGIEMTGSVNKSRSPMGVI